MSSQDHIRHDPTMSPPPDAKRAPLLHIRLFGPMSIHVRGGLLPRLRSRKGLWLLALLAMRGGRPVERDWIAGTLWPDSDETHGWRNLRQTLFDLRAALGGEARRLACEEPRTVRLDLSGAWADVIEFESAVQKGDPDSLRRAVVLYRGPLLEDCAEEWAWQDRGRFEQACAGALESLARAAEQRGDRTEAAERLKSALSLDCFREDLVRRLMAVLAVDRNAAGAAKVYREFRAMLGRELAGEPAAETTELFRRIQEESRGAAPGIAAREKVASKKDDSSLLWRRTSPAPATSLVGREQETEEVCSLIEQSRLVTLTGAGGVGKTRLAIHAAEQMLTRYEAAAFADLAPLDTAAHVAEAVRAAIGADPQSSSHDPLDDVCCFLEGRWFLLVLDNCEHLADASRRLTEILIRRCPGLTILVTSRQGLDARGEVRWRVPPLAVPFAGLAGPMRPSDVLPVAEMADYSAVRLFFERARDVDSTFRLSPANIVSIIRICSRLDGIPLAIELAAARVDSLSVAKIAARLIARFRILLKDRGRAGRAAVPRHETLSASIDWSIDLLTEKERLLLSRLVVFAGGWTLDAAEAVCSDGSIPEWEVADLLSGLVSRSLVAFQPNNDRYRLLETIRQYLLNRLEEDGSTIPASRHASFYAGLAVAAEPDLTGPRQSQWMDRLEAEHDNLRAAMGRASRPGGDIDEGLRIAGSLWRFWDMRGHAREGREWMGALLNAPPHAPTIVRSRAPFGAGELAFRYGDIAMAKRWSEEAIAIQERLGDRSGLAKSLATAGNIASIESDLESAKSHYEKGLALSREIGDRRGTAVALNNSGNLALDLGNLDHARALLQENLEIRRELGDQRGIAIALNNLANVARNAGDHETATRLRTECLELHRKLGNRHGIAVTLTNLGIGAFVLGEHERAEPLLREGLELLWELGDRTSVATNLEAIGCVWVSTGRPSEAAKLLGAAESLRAEIGAPREPGEHKYKQSAIEAAVAQLGLSQFGSAHTAGSQMEVSQAVKFALA